MSRFAGISEKHQFFILVPSSYAESEDFWHSIKLAFGLFQSSLGLPKTPGIINPITT